MHRSALVSSSHRLSPRQPATHSISDRKTLTKTERKRETGDRSASELCGWRRRRRAKADAKRGERPCGLTCLALGIERESGPWAPGRQRASFRAWMPLAASGGASFPPLPSLGRRPDTAPAAHRTTSSRLASHKPSCAALLQRRKHPTSSSALADTATRSLARCARGSAALLAQS
jgi:hypothetical protein